MTDWKQRHDTLAELATELATKVKDLDLLVYRIRVHLNESDRQSLRDRGVRRFLRLKETIKLTPVYDSGFEAPEQEFPAGTLVESTISGNIASVYLDNDGDGYLNFPADKLEEVEISDFDVDYNNVVAQG